MRIWFVTGPKAKPAVYTHVEFNQSYKRSNKEGQIEIYALLSGLIANSLLQGRNTDRQETGYAYSYLSLTAEENNGTHLQNHGRRSCLR